MADIARPLRQVEPTRLPKTQTERDFDKMMRDRRPSVWEDKGAVGDPGFRSLKGAAKHCTVTEDRATRTLLPHITGIDDPSATRHVEGAHRAPASNRPDFDAFMRIKNGRKKEKGLRHVLGDEGGTRHDLPHHLGKLFTQDTRKWQSITASEYGRTFGERFGDRNSAALGANLFRDERAAEVKRQMKTVETILKSFENDQHVMESRNSVLPFLNPRASTLRVGAGHIKVDLSAEEMHVTSGVHKPWRVRDPGGMSPPIKIKARQRQDAKEAEEFRQLQNLYAEKSERMTQEESAKAQHKREHRADLERQANEQVLKAQHKKERRARLHQLGQRAGA